MSFSLPHTESSCCSAYVPRQERVGSSRKQCSLHLYRSTLLIQMAHATLFGSPMLGFKLVSTEPFLAKKAGSCFFSNVHDGNRFGRQFPFWTILHFLYVRTDETSTGRGGVYSIWEGAYSYPMSDDVENARCGERCWWLDRVSVIPNIATRSFTVSCAGRSLLFLMWQFVFLLPISGCVSFPNFLKPGIYRENTTFHLLKT